ncbi:hypothetical protein BMS3Bbin04_01406 [bacterium BMS3Bbin04]|nr:hypothetical protein BMS3Bbin04_01406 [bacterium BMS3Bbin04]
MKIVVLNTMGQQVKVADGVFASGPHQLTIDAKGLSSGMYFVRLTTASQHAQMQRITLLK